MTTFDEREKSFERKFQQDQEVQFKVANRRNKLLGLWAAAQLGKAGADAEAYAKDVVMSDFEKAGDDDVLQKVVKDLQAAGKAVDPVAVRTQMSKLMDEAKKQVMGEV